MKAIYARVSTEEQAKHGYSLNGQIASCQAKAGEGPFEIYTDEGVSGELLDRPALRQLREDIRVKTITHVICYDPDRLSRKLMNQLIVTEELDKSGVELVFVNGDYAKTPEGQLFYSMRGAIAEFEKAKITERMGRGRLEKARQGKILKNYQLYGYNYDPVNGQIVPHPEEAVVVQLIFDLFVNPRPGIEGINGIAKYLTQLNIPTKRGAKVWHRQVVRQILGNETYSGTFYQNRWQTEGMFANKYKSIDDKIALKERPEEEWIPVPCPAIIDEETFTKAAQLLAASRRRWSKQSKHAYLLSGMLRCGHCGNTMTGEKTKHWGRENYVYTDRKNYSGAKQKGCGRRISCETVDCAVMGALMTKLDDPDALRRFYKEASSDDAAGERKVLNQELSRLRQRRERLLNLYADGGLQLADVKQALKDNDLNQAECRHRLEMLADNEIEGEPADDEKPLQSIIQDWRYQLTFADQQTLLRTYIKEIIVDDNELTIQSF